MTKRTPKTLVLLCGLTVAAAACALPLEAKAQIVVTSADYEPMYYDGYVVFFDDWGRPYIFLNGVAWYIPNTYAYYNSFVGHYRMHRVRYHSWYRSHGLRYRSYRRTGMVHRTPAPSHRGPAVHHRTPAPSHRGPAVHHRAPSPSHRGPAVHHRAPVTRTTVTTQNRHGTRTTVRTTQAPARSPQGRPSGRTSSSRSRGR